jgi:hypothetical protein
MRALTSTNATRHSRRALNPIADGFLRVAATVAGALLVGWVLVALGRFPRTKFAEEAERGSWLHTGHALTVDSEKWSMNRRVGATVAGLLFTGFVAAAFCRKSDREVGR